MYTLNFSDDFENSLNKLDKPIKEQIIKKVFELKSNPYLGKRLVGSMLWSLHINKYRVLYYVKEDVLFIFILDVIKRKHDYGNLDKIEDKFKELLD